MQLSAVQCNAMQSLERRGGILFCFFLFCFVLFICLFEFFFCFGCRIVLYSTVPPALYCNSSNCLGILHCKLLYLHISPGSWALGGTAITPATCGEERRREFPGGKHCTSTVYALYLLVPVIVLSGPQTVCCAAN